jgi:hypothetical protein
MKHALTITGFMNKMLIRNHNKSLLIKKHTYYKTLNDILKYCDKIPLLLLMMPRDW